MQIDENFAMYTVYIFWGCILYTVYISLFT